MLKSITYDDILYQLVPKEPTIEQQDAMVDRYFDTRDVIVAYKAGLSAAPTPSAQPDAQGGEWTMIAPDGTKFTGPTPLKAALPASKYRLENDPVAMDKFLQTIDQIAEEGKKEREQCMRDYGTLDCPYCGGSGHIADAVANGFPPPAQPAERRPLTDEQMLPYIKRCADYYGYKGAPLHLTAGAGFWTLARAVEAAHGIKEVP